MAPPPGTLRVGRYISVLLFIFVALYAVVFFPGQRHTPKLGIDLVGGIRVIFTAQTPKGSPPPTSAQMTEARQILENRINTTGVTGATVVVQGSDQLVVEIPDATKTDVANLGKAAILNFRGVIAPAQIVSCGKKAGAQGGGSPGGSATTSPSAAPSASGGASPTASHASANPPSSSAAALGPDAVHRHRLVPSKHPKSPAHTAGKTTGAATPSGSGTATGTGTATGSGTPTASPSPSPTGPVKCDPDPLATAVKQDPTLKGKLPNAESCPSPSMPTVNGKPVPCHAFSTLTPQQQAELTNALRTYDCNAAQVEADRPGDPYIACDDGKLYGTKVAYLLGHVVVAGHQIGSASAQAPDLSGNGGSAEWTVALTLGDSGASAWHAWTSQYNTTRGTANVLQTSATAPCGASAATPCSDFVAFTLDGQVISAPVTLAVLDRQTSISGNFDQTSADALAQELNYGKLPVSFRADQNQHVSATLGSAQLKAAFLAGGIGLILVVLYSLSYYRGLGLITIASLLVSGGLTYAMLVILGAHIGFTLDLAGIAGFIVALGITADSFVVFFERIKDEVHEGRSARVAVPRAWVRARRTILSADTVSFLAAAILYYFASADVKGFAFTLGLSTILDLVVVFLFTHPVVSLLSRSRAFGSKRFTGLDHVRVGGIAVADEEPVRRSAPRGSGQRKRPGRSSTALAEPDTAFDVDDTELAETDDVPETQAPSAAEDAGPSDTGDERPARRHTTPEPGTAAERAAARRARMRQNRDGDSSDGKGTK